MMKQHIKEVMHMKDRNHMEYRSGNAPQHNKGRCARLIQDSAPAFSFFRDQSSHR